MTRIGLLGGSFDPVHRAHIALADCAVQNLQLDELQLIPAANPWQRPPLKAAPEHRLAMLELAVEGHPKLSINPIELCRTGPTYTLDTLKQLSATAQYLWVLGSDQLTNFCTWNGWQEILHYVQLAVAQRPHSELQVPDPLAAYLKHHDMPLHMLNFTPMDISATTIRARLKQQESTAGLLDPKVRQYIKNHQLYLNEV